WRGPTTTRADRGVSVNRPLLHVVLGTLALVLGALLGLTWPAGAAYAITVTTTADEFSDPGPGTGCSFPAAGQAFNTNAAFGGCTFEGFGISFAPSTNGIPIQVGAVATVTREISIVGNGANQTIIDGGGVTSILDLQVPSGSPYLANVRDITFQN